MTRAAALRVLIAGAALAAACGKEGPPLPPLVRVPVAPAELRAERRGDGVDLHFAVPSANADGSRPADVSRVDVYAITGPPAPTDDDLIQRGTRIGSVAVKPPSEEEEAAVDGVARPPVSDAAVSTDGVDQGAVAQLAEDLTPDLFVRAAGAATSGAGMPGDGRPLLGPPSAVLTRTYAAVGVSGRSRRGAFSSRVAVPLVPAPAAPAQPTVAYDEAAASLTWSSAGDAPEPPLPAAVSVLPSRSLAVEAAPSIGYYVYELAPLAEPPAARTPRRLTEKPIPSPMFRDERVEWGAERCYTVSVVQSYGNLAVESEPAPPRCVTFVDTFAPATPDAPVAVASEGAISLIWDANTEKDLAGYVVLRADVPGAAPQPITSEPVQGTSYRDTTVTAGQRYAYVVQAVDKSGNASRASAPVEETAR